MGAGSRKINNARSTQIFNEGQDIAAHPYAPGEEDLYRQRALRPIQAAYGANERKMKQAALTSGGSPNLIAALAKSARDKTASLDESYGNANANLLEQGFGRKMAGLQLSAGAPPIQGFNWSKLADVAAGIGTSFIGAPGLGSMITKSLRGPKKLNAFQTAQIT